MKFAADPDVVAETIEAKKREVEPPAPTRDGGMLAVAEEPFAEVAAVLDADLAAVMQVRPPRDVLAIGPCHCDTCRGRLREGEALGEVRVPIHVALTPTRPRIDRRRGRFKVSRQMLEDAPYEAHEAIFGRILVLDARGNFATDYIEYYGCSRYFDIVERGEEVPEYEMALHYPPPPASGPWIAELVIRRKH